VVDAKEWRLSWDDLGEDRRRIILACYHWWQYQEERSFALPEWFTQRYQAYVRDIYRMKIHLDELYREDQAAEQGEYYIRPSYDR